MVNEMKKRKEKEKETTTFVVEKTFYEAIYNDLYTN